MPAGEQFPACVVQLVMSIFIARPHSNQYQIDDLICLRVNEAFPAHSIDSSSLKKPAAFYC
jgi:hypothetical protein